jgi:endonuclease/exonuclease/phosphatase family metal-dependent hydrolase
MPAESPRPLDPSGRPVPQHAPVGRAGFLAAPEPDHLRVVTYNIHKGVRGMGPRKRLEIHNLGQAVQGFGADLVALQEVRLFHHRHAQHFRRKAQGWPEAGQAEFLAPEGYAVAYRTNAVTRHGEHGNALLSRFPIGDIDSGQKNQRRRLREFIHNGGGMGPCEKGKRIASATVHKLEILPR